MYIVSKALRGRFNDNPYISPTNLLHYLIF